MPTVEANPIPGMSVYGVPQMSYTVDGEAGKCYMDAVVTASLAQATAFERECNAVTALTRLRMQKLEDLGEALSILVNVISRMPVEDPESDDEVTESRLARARSLMSKYGMSLSLDDDDTIERGTAQHAQNDVQYAMDREDNELQQDLVTVQGFFNKRDNAFTTATSLMNKVFNPAKSITGNL